MRPWLPLTSAALVIVAAPRDAASVDPAPVRLRWPSSGVRAAPGLASDDVPRVLGTGLRAELREGRFVRSLTALTTPFVSAVRCEGRWVFATADGALYGADGFLAPLRGITTRSPSFVTPWTRGLATIVASDALWLSDGQTAWPSTPSATPVRAAAFASPTRGAAVDAAGAAWLTDDRGSHWRRVPLEAPASNVRFDGRSLVIDTVEAPLALPVDATVTPLPVPEEAMNALARELRRHDPSALPLGGGDVLQAVPDGIVLVRGAGELHLGLVHHEREPPDPPPAPRVLPWGDGALVAGADVVPLRVSADGRMTRLPEGVEPDLVRASTGDRAVSPTVACERRGAGWQCHVRALAMTPPRWHDVPFADDGNTPPRWTPLALHRDTLLLARGDAPWARAASLDLRSGRMTPAPMASPIVAATLAGDGATVALTASPTRFRRADGALVEGAPDGAEGLSFADACRGIVWGTRLAHTWRTTRCGEAWERVPVPPSLAEVPHPGGRCDARGCTLGDALALEGWGPMEAAAPPEPAPPLPAAETSDDDAGGEERTPPATMRCVESAYTRRAEARYPTELRPETVPDVVDAVPIHPDGTTRFLWRHGGRSLRAELAGRWDWFTRCAVALGPVALFTGREHMDARLPVPSDLVHVLTDGSVRTWAPFPDAPHNAFVSLRASSQRGSVAVVHASAYNNDDTWSRDVLFQVDAAGAIAHATVRAPPRYAMGFTAVGFLRGHAAFVQASPGAPATIVALDDPTVRATTTQVPTRLSACAGPRPSDAVVMRSSGGWTGHTLAVVHVPRPPDVDEWLPPFRLNSGDDLRAYAMDLRFDRATACVESLWFVERFDYGAPDAWCHLRAAGPGALAGTCGTREASSTVRCTAVR